MFNQWFSFLLTNIAITLILHIPKSNCYNGKLKDQLMKKKIVSLKCFLRQHKEIGFHNVLRLNRIHGVISRVLLGRGSNITDSLQR